MTLTNLVHSLQDLSTTLSIVNENSIVNKTLGEQEYINKLKNKSVIDLNNIINDLKALQKERIGLEMGAWRV
jgi:hypothetical protein|tara:strand:- start:3784 stop:3999 length:216 start_codon:yes stop_codon:yes gene_type:complete